METSGGSGTDSGQAPEPQEPSSPPSWQAPPPAQPQMPAWSAGLTSTAPVAGPAGFFYADVPNRAIAYIIDVIIIGIVSFIIGAILQGILGPIAKVAIDPTAPLGVSVSTNWASALVVTAVDVAISAGYFIYTWTSMRGTVGMKVLGMQVGNEADGSTISMDQAVWRWVLLGGPIGLVTGLSGVSALSLLVALLGFIWFIALLVTTAQSPTKQGLHDRYAHTMVVKAARQVA